jgi:hypothetical protein
VAWRRFGLLRVSRRLWVRVPPGQRFLKSAAVAQRDRAAEKIPGPWIPATKSTDVVKGRVTSIQRALRPPQAAGEGCGFEARLLRKKQKLKQQTRTDRSHRVSRDGGVQRYFVSNTMRVIPANSARFFLPARICKEVGRGEGQGYFACGAGGRGFDSRLAYRNS